MAETGPQSSAEMFALLTNLRELPPETRELVRDFWMARLVPEIYGDNVDDDKTGLKGEVRNLRRLVMSGGAVALLLQVIQTFSLA